MNDDISVLMKQCMEFPSLKMNGKRPTTSKLHSCVPVSYYFSEQTNCYLNLAFIKTQRGRRRIYNFVIYTISTFLPDVLMQCETVLQSPVPEMIKLFLWLQIINISEVIRIMLQLTGQTRQGKVTTNITKEFLFR